MNARRKFIDRIDTLEPELIELTQRLVQTPSENPPGDERAVSRVVSERLEALGFSVELVEPDLRRVNTLGRLEGSGGGRNFLFNGHYDTVPVGNLDF